MHAWILLVSLSGQLSYLPLLFEENFEKGAERWNPTDAKAWKVEAGKMGHFYCQHQQSNYKPKHRSPFNFSLIQDLKVTDFDFRAKVQSTIKDYPHRDMVIVFGYQDPSHFYYVHFGKKTDDHANQIFLVNDAPRVKISSKTTPGTPWTDAWHKVRVTRDVTRGTIAIYFDDMEKPIMEATDKTFAWGQVGVGSFDDTGNWDDIQVYGRKK